MTPPTDRTIYAVVYSNYEPPEVAALYADELSAVEDAEARNTAAQTGMWEVRRMTLHERPATPSSEKAGGS